MLNTAVKAARKAGSIINRASLDLDLVRVSSKGRSDFVTEVDRAAEQAIISMLSTAYPNHSILAEESGASGPEGDVDYLWIIDPLDGTTNFIHGFPQYAVSIGLKHRGVITQAVVYDPTRNELFTATRGRGAFLNDRRLRVSKRDHLQDCLIGTGFPFRKLDDLDEYVEVFTRVTKNTAGVRRPGAASLDLAYVAAGRLDGFWEFGLSAWDIAAGSLLIIEAGGMIADLYGNGDYLETVAPARTANFHPFRMPIQWVNRADPDFRGHSGLIASGEVRVGMPVKIFPAGLVTRIARIGTFDGDLVHAAAGRSVTLTFTDPLDASRGDIVADAERTPAVTQRVHTRIFWMKDRPLARGQTYLFKLATTTATARVEVGLSIIDLDTRRAVAADAIGPNEVGYCTLTFDRAVALDRYEDCRDTGSFILIDPESLDTVAMGCVEEIAPPQSRSRLATWLPKRAGGVGGKLTRWTETHARSFVKAVSWRATGSIDTFVVTFVISGSTKLAGSVALTEILTKILIYYGHERIWALVPWGKRQAAP